MSLLDVNIEIYTILNETRNKLIVLYNMEEDIPESKRKKIEKMIRSIDRTLKQFSK